MILTTTVVLTNYLRTYPTINSLVADAEAVPTDFMLSRDKLEDFLLVLFG